MRIIYVTSSFPFGNRESFIFPEIAELQKNGHTISIIPRSPRMRLLYDSAREFLAPNLVTGLYSLAILSSLIRECIRSPRMSLRALALVISFDISRFLKNLAVLPKALWIARTARSCGIDHIHAHWASTTATIAMLASQASGIPWSFTAHRWDIVENNLLELKCHHAAFTRFISQSGIAIARRRGIDVGPRARILHMGVSLPDRMRDRAKDDKPFTMLCPASLVPVKGHSQLIDVLANIVAKGIALQLWIAGEGPLRSALELRVKDRGLCSCVKFLGQLPHSQLMSLYERGEIDAVVLYSLDLGHGLHEGIPVALIEAMAFGIPVISTKTGGIPELLGDGAGYLVSPDAPQAFEEAIIRIIRTPILREKVGERARQKVISEYAIQDVVKTLAEWFQEQP